MNTVTTINLAGRSYTLEEPGYRALKEYLDQAAQKLEHNPDKDEIIKDFELAIAEKCEQYLHGGKNVISSDEVTAILRDMGPVEGTEKGGENQEEHTTDQNKKEESTHPKRLYRIREGEMIGGVCNGIAAYFNIDVTLIRIIFVIFALLTKGVGVLIYFIMMIVVPVAYTSDEKAQASGKPPVTAQALLQKAKEGYTNFKNSKEWRQWKRQMREERRRWKYNYSAPYNYNRPSPFYEFIQNLLGLVWFVLFIWVLWFAYVHIGPVHQTFDLIGRAWERTIQSIAHHFNISS